MSLITPTYLISVIVPVYNCQNTLRRLLDSLIGQTFENYEIIIINDGSTDESLAICQNYAIQYDNIKVFSKKNEGVALARALGLKKATGQYVIHADGDDWVESTMLTSMYDTAVKEDADMVISDFYIDNCGNSYYKPQKFEHHSSADIFYDIILGKLMGSLWNKLIRHELYLENTQYFYPGINYFEDVLSLSKLMLTQNLKVVHLNEAFYHYVSNDKSITHNITIQTFNGLLLYKETLYNNFPGNKIISDYIEEFSLRLFEVGFVHGFISKDRLHGEYCLIELYVKKYRKGRLLLAHVFYKFGLKTAARRIFKKVR